MVAMWKSLYSLTKYTAMVMMMMAKSEPGNFLWILGVKAMMRMLTMPMAAVIQSMVDRWWK